MGTGGPGEQCDRGTGGPGDRGTRGEGDRETGVLKDRDTGGSHIGMPLICEMVLVKKLELETTEINLKNNKQKLHTPALVYK